MVGSYSKKNVSTCVPWARTFLGVLGFVGWKCLGCGCFVRDSAHTCTPHRINFHSVAMTLETLHVQDACGVNGSRPRCSISVSHCAHGSGADCLASVPLHKAQFGPMLVYNHWTARFRGLPAGSCEGHRRAADGSGKRDGRYDLGDAMADAGRPSCHETACGCCTWKRVSSCCASSSQA